MFDSIITLLRVGSARLGLHGGNSKYAFFDSQLFLNDTFDECTQCTRVEKDAMGKNLINIKKTCRSIIGGCA